MYFIFDNYVKKIYLSYHLTTLADVGNLSPWWPFVALYDLLDFGEIREMIKKINQDTELRFILKFRKIWINKHFCNKLFNGLLALGINGVINLKNSIIFGFVVFSGCNEFGQCRTWGDCPFCSPGSFHTKVSSRDVESPSSS